ncbi:MAG: HI0074 family nucleotidyltransferase substrate-binding subunit [Spirochaetaceae bacterium]|nr:HI0074 family nucleotidyltransferase substrate-binding subunit [Spirochaetaceae bacterium]
MSSSDERRWQQRLDNFGTALAQLTSACERERYDDLERAGLIKTFEFCFDLSWNVLKDLLFYEGYDEKVPRAAIRKSYEVDYLDETDCETLLDASDKRNLLSHTCRSEVARDAETLIKERYLPVLLRLHRTLDAKRRS